MDVQIADQSEDLGSLETSDDEQNGPINTYRFVLSHRRRFPQSFLSADEHTPKKSIKIYKRRIRNLSPEDTGSHIARLVRGWYKVEFTCNYNLEADTLTASELLGMNEAFRTATRQPIPNWTDDVFPGLEEDHDAEPDSVTLRSSPVKDDNGNRFIEFHIYRFKVGSKMTAWAKKETNGASDRLSWGERWRLKTSHEDWDDAVMSSGEGTDGENDDGEQNDEQEGDGRWRKTYQVCRFEADESLYGI